MKSNQNRKIRIVYSYLTNRKSFVSGQRRPAGIQIAPFRKLTLRQKMYFGFGKRVGLNGFRRPVKRSLLMRAFLYKTSINLVTLINQKKLNLLNVRAGNLTSFIVNNKKQMNLREISSFGTYLDYTGFLIAKNLWFLRNPSTTPGAARLRRRKSFYGYKIRAVSTLSKIFGNLRFYELVNFYKLSQKAFTGVSTKLCEVGKAWGFIQNIESLAAVVYLKLGYASSINSACNKMQQNKLSVNGHLFSRNFQILHPADFLTNNSFSLAQYNSNYLLISSIYSGISHKKFKKSISDYNKRSGGYFSKTRWNKKPL